MKINSHNEWDALREVILGSADNLTAGLEFPNSVTPGVIEKAIEISKRAYPDWYKDEVNEDLEVFREILEKFGAKVHRPNDFGSENLVSTPDWRSYGADIYNVRDIHMVIGDTVIVSPSPSQFRYFEPNAFYDIWYQYFEDGFKWITAPKPRLIGEYIIPYYRDGYVEMTREDILQRKHMGGRIEKFHKLLEEEILFDAASTIRLGRDLIYLVSNTGNYKGAKWLQSILGRDYKVHTVTSYRASHIDSTILPLRPGLVLINSARVNRDTCPDILKSWTGIYFDNVAPVPGSELEFQKSVRDMVYKELTDLGVNSSLNHISSPWAGMNVLSLDPHTVLVHDRQKQLIRELEKHQLEVIPIQMRHCYTMLGGLHCSTLDVVRDSKLESYF